MGDHARVNFDIWGDDDFLDLPVDAQNLYWTLWTSAGRTYCGGHEWHVGKICTRAADWEPARVLNAAATLSERLFLIIDESTNECLLRSWIKHDGLWRTPNMAVSMANARAALASRTLRGVVVHEVKKLAAAEGDLSSWSRPAVQKMLAQRAIDPASLSPFNPGPNGGINPTVNPPSNPTANPYGQGWVNPANNPGPTPAPATATYSNYKGGSVGPSSHQEPSPRCPTHINHTNPPNCHACADARRAHEAWETDELNRRRTARDERQAAINDCWLCDDNGIREIAEDQTIRCDHQEAAHG